MRKEECNSKVVYHHCASICTAIDLIKHTCRCGKREIFKSSHDFDLKTEWSEVKIRGDEKE